jgi:hypothetical protein
LIHYHITVSKTLRTGSDLANLSDTKAFLLMKLSRKVTFSTGWFILRRSVTGVQSD